MSLKAASGDATWARFWQGTRTPLYTKARDSRSHGLNFCLVAASIPAPRVGSANGLTAVLKAARGCETDLQGNMMDAVWYDD